MCRRCGYAYYGKSAPGLAERYRPGPFGYGAYRCIGSDGHRFDGTKVCTNRPVLSRDNQNHVVSDNQRHIHW